jgi:TolB protein
MRRVVLIAASLASVAVLAPEAQATFPGANGRIAFYDFNEVFGPPSAVGQIYSIAADGSDVQQLTTGRRDKTDPAWSADGSRIAFASNAAVDPVRGRIVAMDADGQNVVVVTAFDGDVYVTEPTWSPDGTQIAFCTVTRRGQRIWIVDADGTDRHRISPRDADDCSPDWSPDGTRIAFTMLSAGARSSIAVMAPDGSNRRRLVARGSNHWPSWSPDGATIVFSRERAGAGVSLDLFAVDVATRARSELTATPRRNEWTPTFSPDGALVAFNRSIRFRIGDLWVIDATDGANPTRLTQTEDVDEYQFSWQPVLP